MADITNWLHFSHQNLKKRQNPVPRQLLINDQSWNSKWIYQPQGSTRQEIRYQDYWDTSSEAIALDFSVSQLKLAAQMVV